MEFIKNEQYLETIYKILNDNIYKMWLKLIDEDGIQFANSNEINAEVALDHGYRHTNLVAENTAKLLYQFGCDEKIIFLGYISSLLHDIGIINGKKEHAKSSCNIAIEYLGKFDIFSDNDINLIENAIRYHGNGLNIKSPIDAFITISDKLDFTKDRRIESKYKITSKIDEILSVNFNIKNGKLIIEYTVTDKFDNSAFYIIPKSIDIPVIIGNKIDLDIEFYINGKIEKFEDRSNYTGYVYGK